MLNASGSMMDNIAEGFERGSNAEFRTFLGYAKGSAGELRSQLLRATDREMISASRSEDIQDKVIRFSKQVRSLILNLKDNRDVRGFRLDA